MNSMNKPLLYGFYQKSAMFNHEKIVAEYVWIDGTGINMRSKCRTLDKKINQLSDIPEWNYDGSSCHQADTENSEVILQPVAFYPDPFRGHDNIVVLCQAYRISIDHPDVLIPANTNFRHYSKGLLEEAGDHEPWFSIEQDYTLFEKLNDFTKQPLGWPENGYLGKETSSYCSVGSNSCFGRVVMEAHYKACLAARLNISGTNAGSMPGSWEFQIGPCIGIEIGDQLWMARYILGRITEDFNIGLSFDPNPIVWKDYSEKHCRVSFSTEAMRQVGGSHHIMENITKLSDSHKKHMDMYCEASSSASSSDDDISDIAEFKYGVGDKTASVWIPTQEMKINKCDGKGYFEDRRPASNADPYIVTAMLCSTVLLDGKSCDSLQGHYTSWIEEKRALEF